MPYIPFKEYNELISLEDAVGLGDPSKVQALKPEQNTFAAINDSCKSIGINPDELALDLVVFHEGQPGGAHWDDYEIVVRDKKSDGVVKLQYADVSRCIVNYGTPWISAYDVKHMIEGSRVTA